MARELGFQNARHMDLESVTMDTFNWEEFVLKEELIRYDFHNPFQHLYIVNVQNIALSPT